MHTKILQLSYRSNRSLRGAALAVLGVAIGLGLLTASAQAATQGYNTLDKTIGQAMAVALASSQGEAEDGIIYVEKSSVGKAEKTLGVVVDPNDDTVAVSTNGSQVYVATSGSAKVYVTDLNGTVKKGDLLAPSPLAGVLMRVVDGSKGVLGVAMNDFPSQDAQSVTVEGSGKAKVAQLQINMDVKFTTNTLNAGKSLLQRLGETIVNHEVSSAQVLVALVILCLLIIVEGGIIYGAISSSIVSLGRNPLAKNTIMKGLGQITGLVAVVLGLGLAAVYLVLWL